MSMQIQVSKAEFQGDPGLFGFLGKAIKGAAGTALGFVPGGRAIQTGLGFLGGRSRGRKRSLPGTGFGVPGAGRRQFGAGPGSPVTKVPGIKGFGQRLFPGGATGFEVGAAAGTTLACPTGFHPNKTDYFTKEEGFIEAGTKCVRNRRRNPLNPGAASKAISRIAAAKRASRALGRVTIRKAECP